MEGREGGRKEERKERKERRKEGRDASASPASPDKPHLGPIWACWLGHPMLPCHMWVWPLIWSNGWNGCILPHNAIQVVVVVVRVRYGAMGIGKS